MSDDDAGPKAPAKKGRKLLRIATLVLVAGGGVGFALYAQAAGLIDVAAFGDSPAVGRNLPKLVARDGVRPTSRAVVGNRPVNPEEFKLSYYPLGEGFTANLRDSGVFVQVALGVSTYYDERIRENIARHEMAIRSAVLMELGNQDPAELATPQGKMELKARLATAVNDVLKAREGFGGVDEVYFTGFVMQ